MFWNQYPYNNLNDLNLDFLLKAIGEMENEVKNFVTLNAVKYADPIQWNITNQYEKNTIVIDPLTGTAYISVQPVPSGVALNRPEYWMVIFDLGSFVTRAAKNFTNRYEQDTTTTATFNSSEGDWLVWGDTLYIANVNITAGDSYIVDGNIRHITVEEVKNAIMQLIVNNYDAIIAMIGDLDNLTTTAKNNLVAAINEINGHVGDIANLTTTDNTSTVNAINEINTNVINITNEVNGFKIRLHNEVNGVEAGIVPTLNDSTTMTNNLTIINDLLQQGKIVYLPDGDYFFNGTILINKHSGIIGESMRGTVIHSATNGNGILVDIDVLGVHSEIIDSVYYTFVLQNFAIFCANYPNNDGAGIRFRNYTWEVDANFDHDVYRTLKGDSYAAEFRNCVCDSLYISAFKNGIESGYYLAYGLLTNMFIETCTGFGIYNKFSDSVYDNITITFCYNGIYEECEQNKFNNIGIKMCGYRQSYDSAHPLATSIGLNINNSKRDVFNNLEVQECYANGAVIQNGSHHIQLKNVVLDANGFSPDAGTSNIGMQILSGSNNIIGSIVATNKNATPTQRLGLYVSDDCYKNQITYAEENQITSVYSIGGRRVLGSLSTTFQDYVLGYSNAAWNENPGGFARYDGHTIQLSMDGYFSNAITSGTVLFDFSAVYRGNAPATGPSYFSGWRECIMWNTTDMTPIKCHVLNGKQLIVDDTIPATKQIHLDFSFPIWLNYA